MSLTELQRSLAAAVIIPELKQKNLKTRLKMLVFSYFSLSKVRSEVVINPSLKNGQVGGIAPAPNPVPTHLTMRSYHRLCLDFSF